MQRTAWGKLRLSDDGVETARLPLVHHCADVAAVVEALLLKGAISRGLARLAGLSTLPPELIRALVRTAFLHDLGKCNRGFQAHEMTVFPKGKHDDQVDSTAQFLGWFKKPFPGQGIFEYYRMQFEKLQGQKESLERWDRLRAPAGIGAVQTGPNRHYNIRPDGTFEMPAREAEFLIPQGWVKIAEWDKDAA